MRFEESNWILGWGVRLSLCSTYSLGVEDRILIGHLSEWCLSQYQMIHIAGDHKSDCEIIKAVVQKEECNHMVIGFELKDIQPVTEQIDPPGKYYQKLTLYNKTLIN